MANAPLPTNEERVAFVKALAEFRGSLNPNEQRMLDALVAAGRTSNQDGDVDVYWLADAGEGAEPDSDLWEPFTGPPTILRAAEG